MAKRAWCFTWNNFSATVGSNIFEGLNHFRYGIYQVELGEQGTQHLQGYIEFSKPTKLSALKKWNSQMHFEGRKGSRVQARDYCRKEDTRVSGPYEFGTWTGGQGERSDIVKAFELVRKGSPELLIADTVPTVWCRYPRSLERYKRLCTPSRAHKTYVQVFIGPTGCGKSAKVNRENPGAYWLPRGTWFDDYDANPTVIIDEFYGWLPYDFMLRLLDRYPLLVATKGGHTQFVAEKIVITSNQRPDTWYDPFKCNPAPLVRRIDEFFEWDQETQSFLGCIDELRKKYQ